MRLLLVEDDAAVRHLTATGLRQQGYTVHEANNGQEGLQFFTEHGASIHLIVTDVVMPVMSGRELSEQVRALQPTARILFVSGYTDDALVRHGILQGEWAILQKPFALTDLAQQVRSPAGSPASNHDGSPRANASSRVLPTVARSPRGNRRTRADSRSPNDRAAGGR